MDDIVLCTLPMWMRGYKIQDGDISGVVVVLSSEESFSGTTPKVLEVLKLKRPVEAKKVTFSAEPSVQDFPQFCRTSFIGQFSPPPVDQQRVWKRETAPT